MPHLGAAHKTITTLHGEDIVFLATGIETHGAVDWVMMQSCYGQNFMLVLEKQDKNQCTKYYAIVLLIGTKQQAENFSYRLELTNNECQRRLAWESKPRSIQDGVASAMELSDCLSFDNNMAKMFSDDQGNLGINVTISPDIYD